jgi:uncharacterized membrane protein YphA (DoxX/SURF4 family)
MTTISFIQPLHIKGKITFLLCLLFGLMFINAGLNKFFNYMPVPDHMPEKMIKMGASPDVDRLGISPCRHCRNYWRHFVHHVKV